MNLDLIFFVEIFANAPECAGRLLTAKGYYGTVSWTYDANGNRTNETLNGVSSTYAYPASSNKLTSVTPAGGSARSFTYDAAGNVATDSRTGALGLTLQHDVEGRLSKVFQTNNTAEGGTYAYDARGRLSSRIVTHATAPTSTTTVDLAPGMPSFITRLRSGYGPCGTGLRTRQA